MKTAKISAAVVLAALAWWLLSPLMGQPGRGADTQQRGPQDVTLQVTWKSTAKLGSAQVIWTFGLLPEVANAKDHPENASGGAWRRDIVLPTRGDEYVVALSASVVPWKGVDGQGQTFRQSTAITCTIIWATDAKSDVSTAAPGDSCAVTAKIWT